MTPSTPRSREARTAVRVNRRTALELARIYVSSSAHSAALEVLTELPMNGWDEETQLLRAESLIGLGRLSEAVEIVGLPVLPRLESVRDLDLWRFLLQLRILHRRGDYRRVIEIGRAYFDAGSSVPSVYLARTAMVVAQSMLAYGSSADARDFYRHVLELYQQLGSREGQVDALFGIANTHLLDCHWDKADALYQEARFRYEELGFTEKALAACINLGVVRVKRGELLSGRDLLQNSLVRATQLGAGRREMTIRLALAMAEIRCGDFGAARLHLNRVIRSARRDHVERDLALALEFLGELHLAEERWSAAESTLNRALAIATRIAPGGDITFEVKRRLAEAALGRGDVSAAHDIAQEARVLAQKFGDSYEVATCERVLADAAAQVGDNKAALELLESAKMLLARLGETFERGRVEVIRRRINGQVGRGVSDFRVRADRHSSAGQRSSIRPRRPGERETDPVHAHDPDPVHAHDPDHAHDRDHDQVQDRDHDHDHDHAYDRDADHDHAYDRDADHDHAYDRDADHGHDGAPDDGRAGGLASTCPAVTRCLELAKVVARLDVPVLLVGEPGSGLQTLSRIIHTWSGRTGPLVPFHCAGLDPETLEAELLGRNGRTGLGQIADGGTLFLDRVCALGAESQRRLARWVALQADVRQGAKVRVVAAIRSGKTGSAVAGLTDELRRELEGVVLRIPPLRERRDDIPLLVVDIIHECFRRFGEPISPPSTKQIEEWRSAHWPGNLAELREAVERYVARCPET